MTEPHDAAPCTNVLPGTGWMGESYQGANSTEHVDSTAGGASSGGSAGLGVQPASVAPPIGAAPQLRQQPLPGQVGQRTLSWSPRVFHFQAFMSPGVSSRVCSRGRGVCRQPPVPVECRELACWQRLQRALAAMGSQHQAGGLPSVSSFTSALTLLLVQPDEADELVQQAQTAENRGAVGGGRHSAMGVTLQWVSHAG